MEKDLRVEREERRRGREEGREEERRGGGKGGEGRGGEERGEEREERDGRREKENQIISLCVQQQLVLLTEPPNSVSYHPSNASI